MYREAPKKGKVVYCPVCCQLGKPAHGVKREGKTSTGLSIAVCSACGPTLRVKKTKYLPGQGVLFPV